MRGVEECRRLAAERGKVLNARQRAFARAIADGQSVKDAAITAGYSERSAQTQGSKLRSNESVVDYIAALEEQAAAELGITEGWVVRRAAEVYERCVQAAPHMSWNPQTRQKEPDGLYMFDARGAMDALKMLGNAVGMGEESRAAVGTLEEYLRKRENEP